MECAYHLELKAAVTKFHCVSVAIEAAPDVMEGKYL